MFHGLHRLGLDEERSLESYLPSVVACHSEECSYMLLLPLHVGIEERHVAFPSTPEDIVLAPEKDVHVK